MKNYYLKFKEVFPTVFWISVLSVLSIALFRWLFTIQFEILQVKEEIFAIWIPLAFPWIPMLIWLRPKLRYLYFKKDDDRRKMLLYFVVWLSITPALITSQQYLTSSTGKLTALSNCKQIAKYPKSRYYTIQQFEVGRGYGGSHTEFRTSGKYNQYLNFDTYLVYPIVSNVNDSINPDHNLWYGLKYKKQISSRLSDQEKEEEYKRFWESSVKAFEAYDFKNVTYFQNTPPSEDYVGFSKAIESTGHQTSDDLTVFTPNRASFSERNGQTLSWTFYWLAIGYGAFLLVLLWPQFNFEEKKGKLRAEKDELIDALSYLIPRGEHFATSVILILNLLVFCVMIFNGVHILSPNGYELLEFGANRRTETMDGQWWRLITNTFLHGGIMHLILNIGGLVIAGSFVEPILGRSRYFVIYLISGILGSLASILWYENTVSVGASGAIFGLYGSILGLMITNAFPAEERRGLLIFFGGYIGINLIYGLTGGIDNAAHIGGLITGLILGPVLFLLQSKAKGSSGGL
jgi:rhomboid protease GluP